MMLRTGAIWFGLLALYLGLAGQAGLHEALTGAIVAGLMTAWAGRIRGHAARRYAFPAGTLRQGGRALAGLLPATVRTGRVLLRAAVSGAQPGHALRRGFAQAPRPIRASAGAGPAPCSSPRSPPTASSCAPIPAATRRWSTRWAGPAPRPIPDGWYEVAGMTGLWLAAALALLPPFALAVVASGRAALRFRLVAVQFATSLATLLLVALSFALDQPATIDLALILAVLTLPGTLLFALFQERWL